MFDPGGSTGHPRACPFLGAWRALLCREGFDWAADGTRGRMERFIGKWMTWTSSFGRGTSKSLTPFCNRSLFSPEVRLIRDKVSDDTRL